MKKLLAVSLVLLASTLAFAHEEDVLKAVKENATYKATIESLNKSIEAKGWTYSWSDSTIERIASGRDLMTGTTTETFLVKTSYSVDADWDSGTDMVIAVVSHVHRNGLRKPQEFTKVNKVYDSTEGLK
jgi:hypothetical protein